MKVDTKSKRIDETGDNDFYLGTIDVDGTYLLARLQIGRDCEAELAVLLRGAAARGILRLDRILPFLTETEPELANGGRDDDPK